MATVDVVVRFLSDTSKVSDDMKKVQSSGDKLKGWAKGAAGAMAGVFAIKEVGQWVDAAENANAVSAALAKSLANAGDATGEWAKHAEDLSGVLMRKTGIDDETIKSGQTILATFHSLTSASGQQANAFDRASAAALDMSKAGFGSVDSASTMLGKALEDPTKGITALGRAGVTFSDDQKKAIKAMVESGDKAGAMNTILAGVESQVGGVAEASATSGDKMRVAWGETQEALGNALLPALEAIQGPLQTIAAAVQDNANWLVPLVAGIVGVVAAIKTWIAVQSIIDALLAANPIGLVVLAIAGLVAAVVLLASKWDEVWSWLSDAPWYVKLGVAILLLVNPITAVITAAAYLASHWSEVWDGMVGATQWAVDMIVSIASAIAAPFLSAIDGIRNAWNGFAGGFNNLSIPSFEIGGWDTPFGSLPSWHSPRVDFPNLPILDRGGIVTRPTLAMLAMNSRPEAVVPLGSGMGTTVVVEVNTTGLGADAPSIQRAVVDALTGYTARNGPIPGIAV